MRCFDLEGRSMGDGGPMGVGWAICTGASPAVPR